MAFLRVLVAVACVSTARAQNTVSSITYDFAVDAGATSQLGSGLLHGLDTVYPAQYLIDGVNVRSVRGADYHPNLPSFYEQGTYDRTKKTGAELMIGVYYYTAFGDPYRPGDNGDWTTWEETVAKVVNESEARDLDVLSFITWNEPRLQFSGQNQRYFEVHCRAHKVIKRFNPNYRTQAPEDHAYSLSFFIEFLTYARENDCIPDILAWHELSGVPLDVEGHSREIAGWLVDNGYPSLDLAVTEYQGITYQNDDTSIPGVNVFYLASMERAAQYGFKYGLHACWTRVGDDPDFIATLADMADRDTATLPRGMWWNYNAYKDMTGRKIGVTVDGANGDSFAAYDDVKRSAVALIGTRNGITPHDVRVAVRNLPDELVFGGKIHIQVERVINAMVLTSLEQIISADFPVIEGTVGFGLPTMIPNSAYIVRFSAVTSDMSRANHEAEALNVRHTDGAQHRTLDDALVSRSGATVFEARKTGDFVEYTIPAPGRGVYHLSAHLARGSNHGLVQLYVDDESVSGPVDMFGEKGEFQKRFGAISVGDGDLTLRFEVVGRHPDSEGLNAVFDSFELARLN